MKINRIEVTNVLGARNVAVDITAPLVLFCGHNWAGKSSLRDAIALALTGEPTRIALKKNYAELVSTGAREGRVEITADGRQYSMQLPSGVRMQHDDHAGILPLCLNPHRIAQLSQENRQTLVYWLAGVSVSPDVVGDRLAKRDCDPGLYASILPLILMSGFEAARQAAENGAREERGVWRAITGETYGSKKGARWQAPTKEFFQAGAIDKLRDKLATTRREAHEYQTKLAIAERECGAAIGRQQRLDEFREKAGLYARREVALRTAEIELRDNEAAFARQKTAASINDPVPCPCCGAALVIDQGRLITYAPPAPPVETDLLSSNGLTSASIDMLRRMVHNQQRDLAEAELAAENVKRIEDEIAEENGRASIVAFTQQGLTDLLSDLAGQQTELGRIEDALRTAAAATERTKKAAGAHAHVAAWEAIAEALSVGGIPAELAKEALSVLSAPLKSAAESSGWPLVSLTEGMDVLFGGRPYHLCSESEQWCADAMLGYAVATLSGIRLLMLDRFDVLDPVRHRQRAIQWLLGAASVVDTTILLGTLKQAPVLPAGAQVIWLANGVNVDMSERTEAA